MIDLKGKRVLVTGHAGMLGQAICRVLRKENATVLVDGPVRLDLADTVQARRLFRGLPNVHCVVHAAGWNGGIAWNQKYPFEVFERSTLMGLNVVRNCVEHRVEKLVGLVASCAYPAATTEDESLVLREDRFGTAAPHPSVACHGHAKQNLFLASRFAFLEHGLNAVTVCPPTLYGPGDRYDFERSKVVAAMVRRFADAASRNDPEVVCWGTGRPLREICYVEDCAELVVQALRCHDDPSLPLNVGTGQEASVREIAEQCARSVSYQGTIRWDESRPDGATRKRLDLSRMRDAIPGVEATPFEDGLKATVRDYHARTRR